jgi:excisionase family DNA binding protein
MSAEALVLSRPEAAQLLGISVPTLDRRLRDGVVPSIKLGGRRLVPRRAIDAITWADLSFCDALAKIRQAWESIHVHA